MPVVIRASDLRPQPWKNGGGVTREIAVEPPGASMDDFAWRVSTAEVGSEGPFSRFEGVDRVLVLLTGEGMDLVVGGAPPVRLVPGSEPFAFPGDAPVTATLPGGPITDLNVMVRRGAWTADVRRRRGQVDCAAGAVLVVGADGDVTRLAPGEGVTLDDVALAVALTPAG